MRNKETVVIHIICTWSDSQLEYYCDFENANFLILMLGFALDFN